MARNFTVCALILVICYFVSLAYYRLPLLFCIGATCCKVNLTFSRSGTLLWRTYLFSWTVHFFSPPTSSIAKFDGESNSLTSKLIQAIFDLHHRKITCLRCAGHRQSLKRCHCSLRSFLGPCWQHKIFDLYSDFLVYLFKYLQTCVSVCSYFF